MQPTFQNGMYYTPGKRVLAYFIVSKSVPIVVGASILMVIFSYLNSLLVTMNIPKGLPSFPVNFISLYILPAIVILGIAVLIYVIASSFATYFSVKFMFDEFAFHIEHGIVSKSEIAIPYRNIQNITHEQTLNEKTWGTARIIVETAATNDQHSHHGEGELPLLDMKTASALEAELLRRTSMRS